MMVEGTVDVQGTVKVDNTAFVQKYLANARRAKEKEDWEEVEKYYNMVEQNDPDNIEAIFYSAYGKAKTTLTDEDVYKRAAAFKVLKNCISLIDDHYKIERREECKEAIISMSKDLGEMICSDFVYTKWKNGYGIVTKTNKGETVSMFFDLLSAFKESIKNIQKVDDQPYLHKTLTDFFAVAILTGYWKKEYLQALIDAELALWKQVTAAYWEEHPEEKATLNREKEALTEQINSLESEISSLVIPEAEAVKELVSKKEALKREREALSALKVGERRKLYNLIYDMNTVDIPNAQAAADAAFAAASTPLQAQIDEAKAKIAEIDAKLTHLRE